MLDSILKLRFIFQNSLFGLRKFEACTASYRGAKLNISHLQTRNVPILISHEHRLLLMSFAAAFCPRQQNARLMLAILVPFGAENRQMVRGETPSSKSTIQNVSMSPLLREDRTYACGRLTKLENSLGNAINYLERCKYLGSACATQREPSR